MRILGRTGRAPNGADNTDDDDANGGGGDRHLQDESSLPLRRGSPSCSSSSSHHEPPLETVPSETLLSNDSEEPYLALPSPGSRSMRVRMRKQQSVRLTKEPSFTPDRLVRDVKKMMHLVKPRAAFKTNLQLSVRIAFGVLLAGAAQTRASAASGRQWYFLPASYYLGGLSWAAMMVIFAASRNIGGAIQQIWQIDVGVAIALLYNFSVFWLIPMNQEGLVQIPANFGGREYMISLHDWGKIVPLILVFTFLVFVSPMETNVKKFAVSTNLYFMLTNVSPMNPIDPMRRKDLGRGIFSVSNVMKNLAVYSVVGAVGTFISLATMTFPYPIFAIRQLKRHVKEAPQEIREIMNLMVDAYCFRVRDIREMDFFRIKLDRLMTAARDRHREMETLLGDSWWEEIVGGGLIFRYNKTIAKQYVQLIGRLLKDLDAMRFAIELETCHWTHTTLMKRLQRNIYLLQTEINDVLQEVSGRVIHAETEMPELKFTNLEITLERLIKKYTRLYGDVLAHDIKNATEVGTSMPLNLFLYSLHAIVHTLIDFEQTFNNKDYSTTHRVMGFLKLVLRSFWGKESYPRSLLIFSLRTTFGVLLGILFSTFVFAFSSTVPNAIAMVAQHRIGGTYGNTVNRLSGLVAGTVLPSIFGFFICKTPSTVLYNLLINLILLIWTSMSMYVFYSGEYIKTAGMVSSYMATSVLYEHSCRSQNGFKALSYSSLTENSLGILILVLTELIFQPRSARGLLRNNIQDFLKEYKECLGRVCKHHLAMERGSDHESGVEDLLDNDGVKELRKMLDEKFPKKIEEQAKMLKDATLEPDLWRPVFSTGKYAKILDVSRHLVGHLRVLIDLVDWHGRRRSSGVDIRLRQNSMTESVALESNVLVQAQSAWRKSQDDVLSAIDEALETLTAVFSDQFSYSSPEESAIFMQMKEAFRIADVHRRGEVDASELAVLLERLIPYSARGSIHMDQYVADFMQLVDRNHDGKVSYAEFMDALNKGFRLELEIYEDMRSTGGIFRQPSLLLKSESNTFNNPESSSYSTKASEVTPVAKPSSPVPASGVSVLHKLWASQSLFSSSQKNNNEPTHRENKLPSSSSDALLNVESFSIKDATHRLRQNYGDYLILQTTEGHVAVEDFMMVSCVIGALDEIAKLLMTLNTLAAT